MSTAKRYYNPKWLVRVIWLTSLDPLGEAEKLLSLHVDAIEARNQSLEQNEIEPFEKQLRRELVDEDDPRSKYYLEHIHAGMVSELQRHIDVAKGLIAEWRRRRARSKRRHYLLRTLAVGATILVAAAEFFPVAELQVEVALSLLFFILTELILDPLFERLSQRKARAELAEAAKEAARLELHYVERKNAFYALLNDFKTIP